MGTRVEFGDVNETIKRRSPAFTISDCKSLFGVECKSEATGLGVADRRCSIEVL